MKKLQVHEREKADGLSREVTDILKPSHVCGTEALTHTGGFLKTLFSFQTTRPFCYYQVNRF